MATLSPTASRTTRIMSFRDACRALSQEICDIGGHDVLEEIYPESRRRGNDLLILNPHRDDHDFGSFVITLRGPRAGWWADFASSDPRAKGRDLVSLVAYTHQKTQGEALRYLRRRLRRGERGGR